MKTLLLKMVLVCVAMVCARQLRAQTYSREWHTIHSGGTLSVSGTYSLNGSVAQPGAAGHVSGDAYQLAAGFWTIQTPGAPLLSIQRDPLPPKLVRISWPSDSSGFILQQCNDLTTQNWTAATNAMTDNGTIKFISVDASAGRRFFRLVIP